MNLDTTITPDKGLIKTKKYRMVISSGSNRSGWDKDCSENVEKCHWFSACWFLSDKIAQMEHAIRREKGSGGAIAFRSDDEEIDVDGPRARSAWKFDHQDSNPAKVISSQIISRRPQ